MSSAYCCVVTGCLKIGHNSQTPSVVRWRSLFVYQGASVSTNHCLIFNSNYDHHESPQSGEIQQLPQTDGRMLLVQGQRPQSDH